MNNTEIRVFRNQLDALIYILNDHNVEIQNENLREDCCIEFSWVNSYSGYTFGLDYKSEKHLKSEFHKFVTKLNLEELAYDIKCLWDKENEEESAREEAYRHILLLQAIDSDFKKAIVAV